MERKTKHRILGVLVTIGLVIILLPLFQDGKGIPTEVTSVKAPPFPDQPVQTTANALDEVTPVPQDVQSLVQQQKTIQTAENNVNQQPDETIPVAQPTPVNAQMTTHAGVQTEPNTSIHPNQTAKAAEEEPVSKPADLVVPQESTTSETPPKPAILPDDLDTQDGAVKSVSDQAIEEAQPISKMKKAHHVQKPVRASNISHAPLTKAPLDTNGLAKLKSAVWVIQLGSFKNKANALRLVNQLRASGYKAFIQQISTALGDSTRVFVGPENKQSSARQLADQLESDMHLKGIVISYKPFAL